MDRKISDCAHEFLLPKPTIGSAAPVHPTARSRSSEYRANERTTPLLDGPSAPKHAALLRCHRITGQVLKPHDSGPSAFPPPFVGVRDTRHQLRPCFCHAPSAPALQRYVHYASDARSAAPAAPANRGGPPLTADPLSSPPTFASKGGGPTAVRRHALTALFFASSAWPENRTVAAASCELRAASCELRVAACNRVLLSSAAPGRQSNSPTLQHSSLSYRPWRMLRIRSLALPFCCSAVPESCMHSVGPSAVGACSEPRHPTLSSTIGSLSPLRPSHATLSYAFKGTSSSAHIFQPSRHLTLPDTLSVGSTSRRAFLLASIFVVVVSSFLHLLILILLLAPSHFLLWLLSLGSFQIPLPHHLICATCPSPILHIYLHQLGQPLSLFGKAIVHPHDFICALARSSTSVTFISHHIAT